MKRKALEKSSPSNPSRFQAPCCSETTHHPRSKGSMKNCVLRKPFTIMVYWFYEFYGQKTDPVTSSPIPLNYDCPHVFSHETFTIKMGSLFVPCVPLMNWNSLIIFCILSLPLLWMSKKNAKKKHVLLIYLKSTFIKIHVM